MTPNVRKPSRPLSYEDAIEVWLLYWEGHFQNRIAAQFDTNSGRISEVVKERRHVGSKADAMKRRNRAA